LPLVFQLVVGAFELLELAGLRLHVLRQLLLVLRELGLLRLQLLDLLRELGLLGLCGLRLLGRLGGVLPRVLPPLM
jgi:hypothetical protein